MNGRRYEGEPGTAEYKIYQFERYAMRIESKEAKAARAPTTKSMSTLALLARPDAAPTSRSCPGGSGCRRAR